MDELTVNTIHAFKFKSFMVAEDHFGEFNFNTVVVGKRVDSCSGSTLRNWLLNCAHPWSTSVAGLVDSDMILIVIGEEDFLKDTHSQHLSNFLDSILINTLGAAVKH